MQDLPWQGARVPAALGCWIPHFLQVGELVLLRSNGTCLPVQELPQKTAEEATCGTERQEGARRGRGFGMGFLALGGCGLTNQAVFHPSFIKYLQALCSCA